MTDATTTLQELLPDALKVVTETIRQDFLEETGPWNKQALDTSIWLIEKLTGRPKTQEAESDTGLLRKLLQEIADSKAALADGFPAQPIKITSPEFAEKERDEVDEFVKQYGEK